MTWNKKQHLVGNIKFYLTIISIALCVKQKDDYFRFVEIFKKMKIIMFWEFLFVQL